MSCGEGCAVCDERAKIAAAKEKRTWVYIQQPAHFDIPGCSCGLREVEWSEFREHLWCPKCQKDFVPENWGVFEGPVPVNACILLGLNFDRFNLETRSVERAFEEERAALGLSPVEYANTESE